MEQGSGLAPVLIVDDELSMREWLSMMCRRAGFDTEVAEHGGEALERLTSGERFSVVLTDLKMPKVSGIEVLEAVKRHDPSCQVVVMTAFATPETALEALKAGAYDYLMKPFKDIQQVQVVIERAAEKYELLAENHYLKEVLGRESSFEEMVGRSEVMRDIFELIARVAPTGTTVLVTGESGTGKELVAKALHRQSTVASGPFIPVNCGAIPQELIESELFGHVKGAFTGAAQDKKGLFEAANGGTIFLDEVGELPLATQVRFLRVLEERRIKPVGGVEEIDVSCRIVAATNRDLREMVDAGEFREDLFYRLNIIQMRLPPLREREGDLRALIEHFVNVFAERMGREIVGVSAEAMRLLLAYHYPGNVRELRNIIERAVTLERDDLISVDGLPYELQEESVVRVASDLSIPEEGIDLEAMVEKLERTLIGKALERSGGVKTEAAKLLGISFRSMRYRLDKYGMSDG